MSQPTTKTVAQALRITAAVNLLAGAAAILLPDLNAELMTGATSPLEGLTLRYHYTVWIFVATMGVGYAIASRDPEGQTGILMAGALGKIAMVVIWCEMLHSGYGTSLLWGGIAFDGAMGMLFLAFVLPRLSFRSDTDRDQS